MAFNHSIERELQDKNIDSIENNTGSNSGLVQFELNGSLVEFNWVMEELWITDASGETKVFLDNNYKPTTEVTILLEKYLNEEVIESKERTPNEVAYTELQEHIATEEDDARFLVKQMNFIFSSDFSSLEEARDSSSDVIVQFVDGSFI